jgi:FkbH-like protein
MENVKLVIWDLDDTFWRGTLSEGVVNKIDSNMDLVKELVNRGIMCSIVSKNEYDDAIKILHDWGIDDYFIFPQISWSTKGNVVKNLLKQCNLRAENTWFIDDNISNIEEVKHYNPGITGIHPDYLAENDILKMKEFQGKNDKNHSRLKQYKLMEIRAEVSKEYENNEEFLKSSEITIQIFNDCKEQFDRILELINRTNQMNYTKKRLISDDLELLLNDPDSECAYITVYDKFGEYGIVGFYALKNGELLHYLFSCRIIGFGVENYLYKKLGYPSIRIIGDVAVPLTKTKDIDWILEGENRIVDKNMCLNNSKRPQLLLIGGCDLKQASRYLAGEFIVKEEFNNIFDGYDVRTSLVSQLLYAEDLSDSVKDELCTNLPFFNKEVTFATQIFNPEIKVIVYSVVDDYIRAFYKHKKYDCLVGIGDYWDPEEKLKEFNEEHLEYFRNNFTYVGKEDAKVFEANLNTLIERINANTKLIIINGVELDVSEWIGVDRCNRNKEMNEVVDRVIKNHKNVYLVDMRNLVHDKSQLPKMDNRHFDRKTYYDIANSIIEIVGEKIHMKSKLLMDIKDFPIRAFYRIWGIIKGHRI